MDYRIEQLRYLLREDPSSRIFYQLGELLRREGDAEQGAAVLRSGLERHPRYVAAWVSLGRCLRDLEAYVDAEAAFDKALAIDPENAVAAKLIGETAIRREDWLRAVKTLKLARALSGADEALDEQIAMVEERLGEHGRLEPARPPVRRLRPAPPPRPLEVVSLSSDDPFGGADAPADAGAGSAEEAQSDVFATAETASEPEPVVEAAPASGPEEAVIEPESTPEPEPEPALEATVASGPEEAAISSEAEAVHDEDLEALDEADTDEVVVAPEAAFDSADEEIDEGLDEEPELEGGPGAMPDQEMAADAVTAGVAEAPAGAISDGEGEVTAEAAPEMGPDEAVEPTDVIGPVEEVASAAEDEPEVEPEEKTEPALEPVATPPEVEPVVVHEPVPAVDEGLVGAWSDSLSATGVPVEEAWLEPGDWTEAAPLAMAPDPPWADPAEAVLVPHPVVVGSGAVEAAEVVVADVVPAAGDEPETGDVLDVIPTSEADAVPEPEVLAAAQPAVAAASAPDDGLPPESAPVRDRDEGVEHRHQLEHGVPLPTMTLARLALDQGDLPLAMATLESLVERDPGNAEAQALLDGLRSDEAKLAEQGSRSTVISAKVGALRGWLDAVRLAAERRAR